MLLFVPELMRHVSRPVRWEMCIRDRFLSLVFVGCKQTSDMLEVNVKTPPEQIQTSVYWYWIAGNISEEGVVKDLYACLLYTSLIREIGSNAVDGHVVKNGMNR